MDRDQTAPPCPLPVKPPPPVEDRDYQFRVFRRDEERRAFRLERVFWDLLEQAASAKGQKLRDLVFSVIDQEPDAKNLASSLRTRGGKMGERTACDAGGARRAHNPRSCCFTRARRPES